MRILITKDSDLYVAQGLEVGIFAQGKSIEELARRFLLTYLANKDKAMSAPASDYVFESWENGEVCDEAILSFGESVFDHPAEIRLNAA